MYPPIERLCAPIEGTDSALLAEYLGLPAMRSSGTNEDASGQAYDPLAEPQERYRTCERLVVSYNGHDVTISGVLQEQVDTDKVFFLACMERLEKRHSRVYSLSHDSYVFISVSMCTDHHSFPRHSVFSLSLRSFSAFSLLHMLFLTECIDRPLCLLFSRACLSLVLPIS